MTIPRFEPMLATPWRNPFTDHEWLFEVKWDGARGVALIGVLALGEDLNATKALGVVLVVVGVVIVNMVSEKRSGC